MKIYFVTVDHYLAIFSTDLHSIPVSSIFKVFSVHRLLQHASLYIEDISSVNLRFDIVQPPIDIMVICSS